MKKIVTFSLALALGAPLMADSLRLFKCEEDGIPGQTEPQLMGFSMSANGQYVCGTIEQGAGIFLANTLTGEVKWNADGEKSSELRGVSNAGVGIGWIDDDGVLFSFDSGKASVLKAPSGYRYVQGEGISNDGSVMVGSFTEQSFNTVAAVSYGDQGWKALPLPSDDEMDWLKDHVSGLSAAKFVSADGSVILGHIGSFTFPVVWTRNEADEYVPDFFPARYVIAEEDETDDAKALYNMSAMYTCMSNNGKYVGTTGVTVGGPYGELFIVPVIYNTEEKTLKVYWEWQQIDEFGLGLFPRAIADDGTFVGTVGQPQTGSTGSFIMKAGEEQAELFVDAFPAYAEMMRRSDEAGYNVPTGISADGSKILGYTYYSDDLEQSSEAPAYYVTYVISLDGSGVEQTAPAVSTDTQTIYSIDGRQLSRMQKGLNIVRNADGSVTRILKR